MNIFSKFAASAKDKWCRTRETKRKKEIRHDEVKSCADLNVIEFNGSLYISYGNIPIVRADLLKEDAPTVLSQSRKDYLLWKEFYKQL